MLIKIRYPNHHHGRDFFCFNLMNYSWVWEVTIKHSNRICRGWVDHSIRSWTCGGIRVVNAKAVFLVKCYSLWSWLHQMYFQGKAERSLNNKSLQQRKCWEFLTNETANCSESKKKRNETADFVVIILHVRKTEDMNGSCFMAILR